MLFSSLVFVFVFLPVVLTLHTLLRGKAKNYFLLLASLIFYAWGEPKFVFVMITSIGINYVVGILIERCRDSGKAKARGILVGGIVINLAILFVFKYLNFAISNIDKLFEDLIPQTEIALPIGISFFTFQAMAYIVDVYRKETKAQRNPFYLGMYISLFPQLIAGPIVRYSDIEEQIDSRKVTMDSFGEGVRRFLIGFAKKVLVANNMAVVADWAFHAYDVGTLSVAAAWTGAICYTLQIYFDFSGYSDMAIGLGKMLGFNYKENFNYPYLSKSATEFWRRWHMSLGSWFRDYVYIPLGGSRVSAGRHVFNLFVVWALTGIWHGANWTFVAWGLLYFLLITFEKKTGLDKDSQNRMVNGAKHVYAMLFVILGWVLFRADSIDIAAGYIGTMFGLMDAPLMTDKLIPKLHDNWLIMVIAIAYSTSLFKVLAEKLKAKGQKGENALTVVGSVVYPILFLIAVSYLVIGGHNPFIYFNF